MTRGERRKKARIASPSKGTTSAARSMPPRLLREAYSVRPQGDATIASYCEDPLGVDDGAGCAS